MINKKYNSNRYYQCFQNYYNCHSYLDLTPKYYTGIRSSVGHWQLRDMIQVDQSTGEAFYTCEGKMRSLDLSYEQDLADTVKSGDDLTLDYLTRCFKETNGGYIVMGGLNSGSKNLSSSILNIPNTTRKLSNDNSINNKFDDFDDAVNYKSNGIRGESLPGDDSANSSPASTYCDQLRNGVSKYQNQRKQSNGHNALNSLTSYNTRPHSMGLLSFHNPVTRYTETVTLGDMINNAVSIYPTRNGGENQFTSFICNNDSNLYTVDISPSGLSLDRKIHCELGTALNNVLKNPLMDNLLVVTGDSSSIFLVDPLSNKPSIGTIKTSCDSGFGVSFHSNGYVFASTFQDGTCLVYDIRNLPKKDNSFIERQPLHTFKSTRPGHQSGAFRCCKFSQTGRDDLLVLSEHVGRVHIIDLANNSASKPDSISGHQVIVLPYALDQYGVWKTGKEGNTSSRDVHHKVDIYNDYDAFPVPLVYDYEYLSSSNVRLFKDYSFQPNQQCTKPDIPTPEINVPNWNSRRNRVEYEYYERVANDIYGCQHSISSPASHINGEMELSGVDWYGEKLVIGCEDGGLLTWDMNIHNRDNSGNFAYV